MENPKVGDKVLHKNGWRAEVTKVGSVATEQGWTPLYSLRFLEGITAAIVNCPREDFFFPESEEAARGE